MASLDSKQKVTTKKHPRRYVFAVFIIIVAIVVMFLLEATNTTHLFHKSAKVSAPTAPISKLPAKPAAKKNVSTSTSGEKGNPSDKNGQVPSGTSTDPNTWTKSASGLITLKSPAANGTIKSGDTITGSASVAEVQYRLIDDQAGVISQGPISVVGGNFTATISFKAYNSSGRLDIFSTEPSGREINELQIVVRF